MAVNQLNQTRERQPSLGTRRSECGQSKRRGQILQQVERRCWPRSSISATGLVCCQGYDFLMAKISENQEKQSGCRRDRNVRACWTPEKIGRVEGGLTSVMEWRRSRELKLQPAEVITQLVPLSGATGLAPLLLAAPSPRTSWTNIWTVHTNMTANLSQEV